MNIAGQSIRGLVVRIGGMGLLYLSTAVAAKLLGAQEFGVFSSVLSLSPIIAMIAIGGTDIFATKSIATLTDKTQPNEIAFEVALTHAVALLGIAASLIVISTLVVIAIALGIYVGNLTVLGNSVLIFPLLLLIYVRQNITLPVSGAATAIFPEQIILPLLFCGSLLIATGLSWSGNASFVLFDYAGSALVAWISGMIMIRKRIPILLSLMMPLSFKQVAGRLSASRPFLITALSSAVMTNAVTVLVSALLGFHAAGLYFVAVRIAGLPYVPLGVIDQVIMPAAARFYYSNDTEGLVALTRLATTLSSLAGLAIALVIAVFHQPILGFFGREFREASPLLLILLAGQTINCMTGPKISLMRMIGLERECSQSVLFASVLLPILVYFSSWYGSLGVAVCVTVVLVLLNLFQCWLLWVKRGVIALPYGPTDLLGIRNANRWRGASFHEKLKLILQVFTS